ncbi:divergent PAP2 family protein [Comamonas sp. MYb396]|uniref:divergent PAP2 family protein n=1 Tax=Comamonas sp. MYb396 TaxID=2745302 RepID=UPI00309F5021
MDLSYLLTPLLAWLVAGSLKFLINSLRAGKPAFGLIGYGGMPSNHSAIVSSMAALVAFKQGIGHPAFGVALTLAFIVVLDASSLRRQVGKHAQAINHLQAQAPDAAPTAPPLRERMGHSLAEIVGGVVCGILLAWAVQAWLPLYD